MLNNLFGKEKPVKIHFYFDPETNKKRLTVFDKITLDKYMQDTERVVILMSHFMVDDKNQPLAEEKAVNALERLNQEDFIDVINKFTAAFQEAAVPKASGSGSPLPSEAGQAGTLPNG